ncbi:MAG: hypothetical protein AAGC68_01250 [Verrucomicrobiota bacterium]
MKSDLSILSLFLLASALAFVGTSCNDHDSAHHGDHGHDHGDHDHGDHDHGDHDHGDHDHGDHDHGDHDHSHAHDSFEKGPNGGRLVTSVEPHLEFLVRDDRKVQIGSVDGEGKAQPIAEQEVSIVGGDRSNPTQMAFSLEGDVLVSDIAFPEGDLFPVVMSITPTPDGDLVIEKFNLDLSH